MRSIFLRDLATLFPGVPTLLQSDQDKLVNIMLFGSKDLTFEDNKRVLLLTIRFILATKRFAKLEAYSG